MSNNEKIQDRMFNSFVVCELKLNSPSIEEQNDSNRLFQAPYMKIELMQTKNKSVKKVLIKVVLANMKSLKVNN